LRNLGANGAPDKPPWCVLRKAVATQTIDESVNWMIQKKNLKLAQGVLCSS
jgi:hypothetical protein